MSVSSYTDYKSFEELWTGNIEYDINAEDDHGTPLGWLGVFAHSTSSEKYTFDYSIYTVWCEWDNWETPWELTKMEVEDGVVWLIHLSSDIAKRPLSGKYHFKLKKDDEWVEPSEHDVKQKDKNGVWNNVLFIHE